MNASSLKLAAAVAALAVAASLGGCKKPAPKSTPAVVAVSLSGSGGADSAGAGGSGAGGPRAVPAASGTGSANCDCNNVDAGLLTKEYQEQCRTREAQLKQMTSDCGGELACIQARLKLKAGPDGKLAAGEFCDGVTHGDAGWPVQGGPQTPPTPGPKKAPCTKVAGLTRDCVG